MKIRILLFSLVFVLSAMCMLPRVSKVRAFPSRIPEELTDYLQKAQSQTQHDSTFKPSDAAASGWTNSGLTWGGDTQNTWMGDLFPLDGYLYAGSGKFAGDGGEVWRYDGTTWAQINVDGFGDPANFGVYAFSSFDGDLVAGTGNGWGTEIWRYVNGTWVSIADGGFGDTNNSYVDSLLTVDGRLYAGIYNDVTGTEIWRYDGTAWNQINENGFGDSINDSVYGLAYYNDHIYAGISNSSSGARVYRYDGGTAWTKVNSDGFGDPNADTIYDLESFGSCLFAAVYMYDGVETFGQVWQYDGSTWTKITPDHFDTLGHPNVLWIEDLETYNGGLYASAGDTAGGSIWLWDQPGWEDVASNGFGNVNNLFVSDLAAHNGRLFGGTTTLFAPTSSEVWSWYKVDTLPVYRFWNTGSHHHFYTTSTKTRRT